MEVDERRTPDHEVPPAIASGRDATIHALGTDRILRRTPGPRDHLVEAMVMEHVRAAGYPVPQVFRCGPGEMELARIEGPTMLADLEAHPWRVRAHARTLADLHTRLHAIEPPLGDLLADRRHPATGSALLHLDLHPGNVLCSPDGPVVIDWTNVMLGAGPADVGLTWILMAAFDTEPPPAGSSWPTRAARRLVGLVEAPIRRTLVATFLAASGVEDQARSLLPAVAEHRLGDRNVRPAERAAMLALVERETGWRP